MLYELIELPESQARYLSYPYMFDLVVPLKGYDRLITELLHC